MTYYHVSLDVETEIQMFKPRVPQLAYQDEDRSTPRISLSNSIEGCLTGVPWGGRKLEDVSDYFFEVTDGKIFLVFRVYEFDFSDVGSKDIRTTEDLVYSGTVLDAFASGEIWVVNRTLIPTKSYLVALKTYSETAKDIYAKEFYELSDEEMNRLTEFDDYVIGSSTVIESVDYTLVSDRDSLHPDIDWQEWKVIKEELRESNYERE